MNYDLEEKPRRDNWTRLLHRLRDYKETVEKSLIKDAEPSDIKILQGLMEKEDFELFKGARSLHDFNEKFVLSNFM